MSHSLDGCRAKLERAKELVLNLNEEIAAVLHNGEYSVVGEHEFEKRRYVFRLHGPQVPLRISVLAGEVVHHLRCTLDHVVWALASKNNLSSGERITFPVCETSEKFKSAVRNGIIKGISRAFHPLIESLQPYRTADPKNSIIQIVHDLDIMDKHRLLVVVTHAVRMGGNIVINGELTSEVAIIAATPPDPSPFFRAVEDGVEVHWLGYETTTEPKWRIENDFSIEVAFQRIGTVEREPVVPMLTQLCNGIEQIVDQFSKAIL